MTARSKKEKPQETDEVLADIEEVRGPGGQKCENCHNGNHTQCQSTLVDHDEPWPFRSLCKCGCMQANYYRDAALNFAEAESVAYRNGEKPDVGRALDQGTMHVVDG